MTLYTILCCLPFLAQPVVSFPKFYGEWTLWHSTIPDLPDNRVVVHIYPDNQLSLSYRFMRGPVVYHKSKVGTYRIFQDDYDDDEKESGCVVPSHRRSLPFRLWDRTPELQYQDQEESHQEPFFVFHDDARDGRHLSPIHFEER